MSKFAYDTKLCHRSRNSDDIMEHRKISINLLSAWANKWQMSFNVDKCSVMYIGRKTCKATITCPINSCRRQINGGI